MMGSKLRSCSFDALSAELLLKVFSLLPPRSLARNCIVCSSWNQFISNSVLWKNIYEESQKYQLQSSVSQGPTKKRSFVQEGSIALCNWKSEYVKEHHRALFLLGSSSIEEWKGHSKRVECCRLQLDTIVTGSSDGVVRVWSSETLKCIEAYRVPNKSRVVDLEFDENKIVVASGTDIYVWNRTKGSLLRHIKAHVLPLHCICYADPEVLIGCSDGTIRVFDIYSGRCARIFRQHTDRVTCIAVDASLSLLATGSADGTLQLCDFVTGQKICCVLPSSPPTEVGCLQFCHGQNVLLSGTSTGRILAWDMRKRNLLWTVQVGPNAVTSLHSQHYDSTTLLVGSINGIITVLDTENGHILKRFAAAQGAPEVTLERADKMEMNYLVSEDVKVDLSSLSFKGRTPILSLRMGMTKIVTTHPDGRIRMWRFIL